MRYPISSNAILDVTKPPYCADNSGKSDCTKVLRQVFDDLLQREVDGVKQTYDKLIKLSDNLQKNIYDGFENRVVNGKVNILYPEYVPPSKIIYFPKGTYLVSDTITYTIENLQNMFLSNPFSELCRGIHIVGEDSENTVIKLTDNNPKFQKGANKPLVSFVNRSDCFTKQCSNVSQLNTIEDITLDCGIGNPGAVGLLFMSINSGKMDNVIVKGQDSYCGVQIPMTATVSSRNLKVTGFEYGVYVPNGSVNVIENADLAENRKAGIKTYGTLLVCKDVESGKIPTIEFGEIGCDEERKEFGAYYFSGKQMTHSGDMGGSKVYFKEENGMEADTYVPVNKRSEDPEEWICVDDYGAVGDGKTDSTEAIQKAFNSGKSVIIFGSGHYLVNSEITIPATVKTVDFMFCDFFSGEELITGRTEALFHINEDSRDMLFLENVYTFEQFYGYLRFIKHGAKRDLVMKSIHNQASASYFNTIEGSKIYLDNCASTMGAYAYNACLVRDEEYEDYAVVVPYEFHGQTVYGMQVNPERAYIEILNDHSDIVLDAYKVEGAGTAVKTINGGKTIVNIGSAGLGYIHAPNYLFETEEGKLRVMGFRLGNAGNVLRYVHAISTEKDGVKKQIEDAQIKDSYGDRQRINLFDSDNMEVVQ